MTIQKPKQNTKEDQFLVNPPLALQIGSMRRLRMKPISQRTLEYKAGVGAGHLSRMESSRSIPAWFRQILAISYILGVSVNDLIAPHIRGEVLSEINERSDKVGMEGLMVTEQPECFIAAVVRCGFLCIAVIRPSYSGVKADIIDIERRALKGEKDKSAQIHNHLTRVAENFGTSRIIVEPGSPVHDAMSYTGARLTLLTMSQAVGTILPHGEPKKLACLYNYLVCEYPKLREQVTILRGTGRVALTKTWQVYPLLAVALGLAADTLSARTEKR